jgi:hypothetical protein
MMNREVVLRLFLSAAGTYYAAFADEAALEAAVAWFNDNFEWREEYGGNEVAAANDMVDMYSMQAKASYPYRISLQVVLGGSMPSANLSCSAQQ